MIKYNLKCENNHEFESWFLDSKEFEKLKEKKLLECIYCNSKKVKKSIMAPMISRSETYNKDNKNIETTIKDEREKLKKIRQYIEKNFEYVGSNFSRRVREIYYDKKSKKKIYGTTSPKDREELSEEGIELFSIPWIDKEN